MKDFRASFNLIPTKLLFIRSYLRIQRFESTLQTFQSSNSLLQ